MHLQQRGALLGGSLAVGAVPVSSMQQHVKNGRQCRCEADCTAAQHHVTAVCPVSIQHHREHGVGQHGSSEWPTWLF